MRRTLRKGILIGGLLAAALVRTAHAADDPATREAQARFEEGLSRVKADRFEAARISFAQAYAVLHRPSILWNLALVEEKTGRALEALAHFREYVRQFPTDDDRIDAQKHYDVLMAQTGHLEVQAPAGTQVIVDGAPAGIAPLAVAVDVMPGKHHVEARRPQGVLTSDPDVAAGQVARLNFIVADGGESAAPAATGAVATVDPNAPRPPGASAEAQAPDRPPPADTRAASGAVWTPRVITVVAVGGAAVVSLGLGVYFGLQSQSQASTARGYRQEYGASYCAALTAGAPCPAWNDAVDAQNRDATLSDVFYVAGGVLAAGAVATWLLWPRETKGAGRAWVVPAVGARGAGIGAAGIF
jgi:hypothetical protein